MLQLLRMANSTPTTTDASVPWTPESAIARDLPPHLRDFAWLLKETIQTFGENSPDVKRLWSLHRFLAPEPHGGAELSPEEDTWLPTLAPGCKAYVSKRGEVKYVQTLGLEQGARVRECPQRPAGAGKEHGGIDLVGLVGTKGVGKDTAGRYLVEVCGWHRVALATPLRNAVKSMFALTDAQCDDPVLKEEPGVLGVSFRRGAQILGTDLVRKQLGGACGLLPELGEKGLWIQHMERAIADARCKGGRVVITDVRFPDEAAAIIGLGGRLIRITRGGMEQASADAHSSENNIDNIATHFPLLQIENNGSSDELGARVAALIADLH